VKRAALADALARHDADGRALEPLERVLVALEREPDPHTTVDAADAINVHVADSLAALEVDALHDAGVIADLGAGAGFPGLVLAAALAHARVDLIEASRRKAALIGRLIAAGGLANARAIPLRAEELAAADGREAYDVVTARAVAPLAVLAEYAAPLLRQGGALIAWKGKRDAAEEAAGTAAADRLGLTPGAVLAVEPYRGSRNRHLHVYTKSGPTPPQYPRRPGMAAKRPLA
jgi:16S rRNA (guanine527-N7)-methyltransferase